MMAICHTAVPERAEGKITYQAASPGRTHIQTVHSDRSVWILVYNKCTMISVQCVSNNFGILL